MRPIGYYVHHQGIGHWQRARAIAANLRHPCTLIGSFNEAQRAQSGITLLNLPDDSRPNPPRRPGARPGQATLHYAPPDTEALRQRGALIASWIRDHRPVLMVVDVSVEVALLARICGTPVISMRLAGRRDDPPHLAAFEASEALIAPFPASLDEPEMPGWVRQRTFYAGFLAPQDAEATRGDLHCIAAVFGRGGTHANAAHLLAAARATPDHHWQVLGLDAPTGLNLPGNLEMPGWVEDPSSFLRDAGIVIGGCGDGLLAEVAALGRRFICIPEPRPFAEQTAKAGRLAALHCAVTLPSWPQDGLWLEVLRQAEALDPDCIRALHDPSAIQRTATFIDASAEAALERYG